MDGLIGGDRWAARSFSAIDPNWLQLVISFLPDDIENQTNRASGCSVCVVVVSRSQQ
jgi:hypothetical protein